MTAPNTYGVRLDPRAYYTEAELRVLLGLPTATLARARQEGRLRYSRCGRTTYYLGRWVRDWLDCAPPAQEARHGGTE